MDSQWQIYQVFEKERADLPHRNAGSVHASDAEMALENARDVFVRRPNCLSLWVVPERAIFSKTVEELQDNAWRTEMQNTSAEESYLVFQKQGQTARETFVVHVGDVAANSPQQALERALETFDDKNVFVWWIVPERAIIKNEASDAPSMFEPAHWKKYRNHLSYPVEPIMRELKSAQEMLEE
ncbi:MAG: phenylacetic acid degradation protein [Chloroflexota bacterium]|nr:MAG: phenylacetic acid degradation protein [Chloroflexota bacterium]